MNIGWHLKELLLPMTPQM